MKFRLPGSLHNWMSLMGAVIASVTFLTAVILLIITWFFPSGDFYLGFFIYIVLPGIMVAGMLLIPFGAFLRRRRDAGRKEEERGWPCFDLNNPRQRRAFLIFSVGTAVYLIFTAVGSYEAYHVTESVQFCGLLCHKVMEPQYALYEKSPHARVRCADCHVGPGASWFVRSKLSGATQILNTLRNIYPRPLPTPIKNLRPAREVCEQCHWPQKFYAYDIRFEHKYLSNKENTPWDLRLVMKIGSEHPTAGLKEGIHWHINPSVKIEYIHTDKRRQEIPWVRLTNLRTGDVTIYQEKGQPLDPTTIGNLPVRTMDCMDCHNEPSHEFLSPARFISNAMVGGEIPLDLPNVKSVSMKACAEVYPSTEEAMKGIGESIHRYYEKNHPALYKEKDREIDRMVEGVQKAFRENIFPAMGARWDAYPNNIGHREFKGCFRCHNDTHISDKGFIIRKDCNICHLINAQGKPDLMETASSINQGLEFRHPVEIGGAWKQGLCTQCHTGLNP